MKKPPHKTILAIIGILLSFSLWAEESKKAAVPPQAPENKALQHFNGIYMSSPGNLYIQQSAEEKLTIETDDVTRGLLDVYVDDGLLYIKMKNENKYRKGKLDFYLSIQKIDSISLNSTSSLFIPDGLNGEQLKLNMSNLSDGDIKIDVEKLIIKVSSGSKLIAKGNAKEQEITIQGAGEFDGSKLHSSISHAFISGPGVAKLNVANSIAAELEGEAQLKYCGSPKIKKSTKDNAKVLLLEPKECQ